MIRKTSSILALAGLLLTLWVVPAQAEGQATDVGAFAGVARVGKIRTGECNKSSLSPTLTGGGLGVPGTTIMGVHIASGTKTGHWTIDTGTIIPGPVPGVNPPPHLYSATNGWGRLRACGQLGPVGVPPVTLGAACGVSHGFNGVGRVDFGPPNDVPPPFPFNQLPKPAPTDISLQLRDLEWITSAGGTLPVTGVVEDPSNGKKVVGTIVAAVQAQGAGPCANERKNTAPKTKQNGDGAVAFQVVGTYTVVPVP